MVPTGAVSAAPTVPRDLLLQVAALIKRYVAGTGLLDLDTVSMLSNFPPNYVCSLSPKLLDHVQESVFW